MKKVQDRRLSLVINLTKEGNDPIEVGCRADYEVSSDGLTVNRSFIVPLTSSQRTQLKNFGVNVVAQIKAIEE